jgi:hypothetical protein
MGVPIKITNPDSLICPTCGECASMYGMLKWKSLFTAWESQWSRVYKCDHSHYIWEDGRPFSLATDFAFMKLLLES